MSTTRLNQLFELNKQDPDDEFITYGIALEYIKMNNFEKAQSFLEALQKRVPNYVPTYYQLAKVYEQLKRYEDALVTYQKGIPVAQTGGDLKAVSELRREMEFLEDDLDL